MQIPALRAARGTLLPDRLYELAQPVRPEPGRVDGLVQLPAARRVLPELEADGVPVVAEQVGRALVAVQLERRAAVVLDRVARDDRRERASRVAEQQVHGVGIRVVDRHARRHARRHRGDVGGVRLDDRPAERREAAQVVDPDVRQRPDACVVEPGRPGRAGGAVERAGGVHAPDRAVLDDQSRARETSGWSARTVPRRAAGPVRRASAKSPSASLRDAASGFSQSTCRPCSSASRTCAGCTCGGVITTTTSTSDSTTASGESRRARGQGACRRAPRAGPASGRTPVRSVRAPVDEPVELRQVGGQDVARTDDPDADGAATFTMWNVCRDGEETVPSRFAPRREGPCTTSTETHP